MTEEARSRYEEDKPHYDIIAEIVQKELKIALRPFEAIMKVALSVSLTVFAFMFLTQFLVYKDLQLKANASDLKLEIEKADKTYLQKLSYYQIEVDEHRMVQEVWASPSSAQFVYAQINDNIAETLGFKYTMRGGLQ
jgi:c-di-AMP phosphodiesterase-like protein